MSEFHYIASPVELECGSFGIKKIDVKELEILNPYLLRINSTKEIELHFPIDKNKTVEDIKRELEVYETEEDAAGIFVQDLHRNFIGVKKHFENEFIYMVLSSMGSLLYDDNLKKVYDGDYENITDKNYKNLLSADFIKVCIESYKIKEKTKHVLLKYIRDSLNENQYIEFFSSWADEEELERNKSLDTIIYLDDLDAINNLRIQDRQYIRFYLSKK